MKRIFPWNQTNLLALLLTLLVISSACGGPDSAEAPEERPNIVLILIDDLSHYGVGAYGGVAIHSAHDRFERLPVSTPRIDELAAEGMRCDNAFAYPLCENTRIALMSGLNNDRNFLHCKRQHHSDITFGDVFQRAGYATGMFGKWKQTRGTKEIHGKDYIYEFGWDEFACFDVVGEEQRFINPNLVINGEIHNYQGRTDLDPETGRRWYGPDICNRHALDFIDRNKDRNFFLYYPMLLVHDEHKPTPATKPDSLFDNFDEVKHNRDGHTGDDQSYIGEMLTYTDILIGKVVDKLEEHGLSENTLLIVMGDNGTKEAFVHELADGTIYPARKGGNTDNGLHVPLIIRMPGTIGKKQVYDGLVNLTDIFPTMADAAGVEIPSRDLMDGISFWPQLNGQTAEEHREVIYTWYNGNNHYQNYETNLPYAFNKEFKRYGPTHHYPEGRFFDLRTDPLEREGDSFVKLLFGVRQYSGLKLDQLSPEQQEAYDELGKVLEAHKYVAVDKLEISAKDQSLKTGEKTKLECRVIPGNATRFRTIWESSDPEIASIDKFGELTAHQAGEVIIRAFSWDDAYPTSNNADSTYFRSGIQDAIKLMIN